MSSIRKHLVTAHTARAEFHSAMTKAHRDALKDEEPDSAAHKFHQGSMNAHLIAGEAEAGFAMACEKTAGDDLEKYARDLPAGISAVTPDNPRFIPRFGQRENPGGATVSDEFRKLVSVEDSE